MGKIDPRVDAYIGKSAEFAKPILTHLRALIHKACPEVQETIKWGFASFDYKGPLCSMAAFKQHMSFGFWKASLMKDAEKLKGNQEEGMGHLGRITSMKDLPSDKALIGYIKEAATLNEKGIKLPPKKKTEAKEVIPPDYFLKAVKKNKKALSTYDNFSPSCKKEYIMWVTEAKTDETRNKRLETAVEWMAEGKQRNWKYMKK
jgi:uncharacterized protein YdeI (YjbR/CyaY-like superfamily)